MPPNRPEAALPRTAKTDETIKNGLAKVKFGSLSGKQDQAGGLVPRFKDADNYYVVRSNALVGNVVFYETVNGKRSSLRVEGGPFGYDVDTKVPIGKRNPIRVEFNAALFTVFSNGKKFFEVGGHTLEAAGAVSPWTKTDSVTLFRDLSYEKG